MFGILDDILEAATEVVLKPVSDTLEVIDGLTEGELRTKAIARLGADAVGAMAISEIIEWYADE